MLESASTCEGPRTFAGLLNYASPVEEVKHEVELIRHAQRICSSMNQSSGIKLATIVAKMLQDSPVKMSQTLAFRVTTSRWGLCEESKATQPSLRGTCRFRPWALFAGRFRRPVRSKHGQRPIHHRTVRLPLEQHQPQRVVNEPHLLRRGFKTQEVLPPNYVALSVCRCRPHRPLEVDRGGQTIAFGR